MFRDASAFNQDIGSWDVTVQCDKCMSEYVFSLLKLSTPGLSMQLGYLNGWDAQYPAERRNFSMVATAPTATGEAARANMGLAQIVGRITDGGKECTDLC